MIWHIDGWEIKSVKYHKKVIRVIFDNNATIYIKETDSVEWYDNDNRSTFQDIIDDILNGTDLGKWGI